MAIPESLNVEYRQWKFFTEILYPDFSNLTKCEKIQKEYINIFQHWLMEINQNVELPRFKNFPLLPNISSDNAYAKSLIKSMQEKMIFWRIGDYISFLEELFNKIRYFNETYNEISCPDPEISDVISIGDFKGKSFLNQDVLLDFYNECSCDEFLYDVCEMLLRYESLGNGSYQWGDPINFHNLLNSKFNVAYEGFASPINSRVLYLSKQNKINLIDLSRNQKYKWVFKRKDKGSRFLGFCSLFPELDSIFGSFGNFLELSNKEKCFKNDRGWSINPPFVNSIIFEASTKIISILNNGSKNRFFCTYPYWTDSPGWALLSNSKYCQAQYHRSKCVIQDAEGNIFQPYLKLSFFCLSRKPFSKTELDILYDLVTNSVNGFQQELLEFKVLHEK